MSHALFGELADVEACEERIINCWPAPSTLLIDGFALRFAHGYSGRANSASPIRPGAEIGDGTMDVIEQLYRDAGLPPTFRDTPLMSAATRARLDARGYRIKDSSFGMMMPLAGREFAQAGEVEFVCRPNDEWLDGVSSFQTPDKRSPEHLRAIVGAIRVPVFFATMRQHEKIAGFGLLAIDRGYAEIASVMLDPAVRRQGKGRALVMALLNRAIAEGATTSFLQVDVTNAIAHRLYCSLGFVALYRYDTVWLRDE